MVQLSVRKNATTQRYSRSRDAKSGNLRAASRFELETYEECLYGNKAVLRLIAACDLKVMATIVRHALNEGRRSRWDMRRDERHREELLKRAIEGFKAMQELSRITGRLDGMDWKLEEAGAREALFCLKSNPDSKAKALGEPGGSRGLPGETHYLVTLEEYVMAKIGERATPAAFAGLLYALLAGFDCCPDAGIVPESLKTKLDRFRRRNPALMQDIKQKTKCDSSGKNELDRRYGTN
jgi:hypothetical protein